MGPIIQCGQPMIRRLFRFSPSAIVLLFLAMPGHAATADARQIFSAVNAYAHCVAAAHNEQALENSGQLKAVRQGRCNGARQHLEMLAPTELIQRVDNRLAEYIVEDMNKPTKTVIKDPVGTRIREDR